MSHTSTLAQFFGRRLPTPARSTFTAKQRRQLGRGWLASVRIERAAGHGPIAARAHARRNNPGLYNALMQSRGLASDVE